jgi:predicted DNA-binding transcriptional regulator AlpA
MLKTNPKILSASQTAAILGLSEATLQKMRKDNAGPRWFRIGKHIRYLETDITAWIDEQYNKPHGKVDDGNL